MNLQDFLNLPPEHVISFEDVQELNKSIVLNGSAGLTEEQSLRLREYLEVCLLHQAVDPALRKNLETISKELHAGDNGKCRRA